MKISKLFHWLYAILMLLPFAFFIPSILYYAFNDNATMQTVEVPKTETISVDFNQKIDGNFTAEDHVTIRTLNDTYSISYGSNGATTTLPVDYYYEQAFIIRISLNDLGHKFYFKQFNTNFSFRGYMDSTMIFNKNANEIFTLNQSINGIRFGPYNTTESTNVNILNVQLFDLTQMFGSGNEPTVTQFDEWFDNTYYPYTESELMQITYDTGETEQLVQNTDIVNYAWESIWDLPLFSWCKVSFVAVPFTYITGLFGLAPSNSFNYVFTYLASMSIIWLVFDVVLYVPLLVHRWIDKARIE